MQSFDIKLLAGALAPQPPATSDGTGDVDDFFAETLNRELARIDSENAARDAARQDDGPRQNQDFSDSATYDDRDPGEQSLDSFNHTPPGTSDAPADDAVEQPVAARADNADTNDAPPTDKRTASESSGANASEDTTDQRSLTGGSDSTETKTVNFADQALIKPSIVSQLTLDADTPIVPTERGNAENGQVGLQLTPDVGAQIVPKASFGVKIGPTDAENHEVSENPPHKSQKSIKK